MWVLFGVLTVVFTIINLYMYGEKKDYKFAMFLALSFNSLMLCSQYSMVSGWVLSNDMSSLSDVVPYLEPCLWVITIIVIIINLIPILFEKLKLINKIN